MQRILEQYSCCNSCCNSVCLSVIRVLCDKTKKPTADIFTPHERAIYTSFLTPTFVGGRRLLPKICAQSDPLPSKNVDFDRFSLITSQRNVRASKKVQLSRIGSRLWAFRRATDEVRTLPLSPPKGGSKS